MTDAEYTATQSQILLLGNLVNGLDLRGFLSRIEQADAIGPIINPTMYQQGMRNMHKVKRLAGALLEFQRVVQEVTK